MALTDINPEELVGLPVVDGSNAAGTLIFRVFAHVRDDLPDVLDVDLSTFDSDPTHPLHEANLTTEEVQAVARGIFFHTRRLEDLMADTEIWP